MPKLRGATCELRKVAQTRRQHLTCISLLKPPSDPNDQGILWSLISTIRAPGQDPVFFEVSRPGAGTGANEGTEAIAINQSGTSAGSYADSNFAFHGFLRTPDGTFTVIDVAGAGVGPGQGTFVSGITKEGAVTGDYYDSSNGERGFLRSADGAYTTFESLGWYQVRSPLTTNLYDRTSGEIQVGGARR